MTYEELIALCKQGDPIIHPDHPEKASVINDELIILGENGPTDFSSDLRIIIEPNGFRVWMRDPEGTLAEDSFHGREWAEEAFFEEYDSLCTWVYSW